jgi:hypothetical protein
MMTNAYRLALLARFLQIDAVRQYLREKSGKGAEFADSKLIGAVNKMAAGDRGVLLHNQMRLAFEIQLKVPAFRSQGKCGNPIECAYAVVLFEAKQFQPFADGEGPMQELGPISRRDGITSVNLGIIAVLWILNPQTDCKTRHRMLQGSGAAQAKASAARFDIPVPDRGRHIRPSCAMFETVSEHFQIRVASSGCDSPRRWRA